MKLQDVVNSALKRVGHARTAAGDAPWLLGYDVNGIQDYVTANSRPVAMRGASLVVKAFDSDQQERGALFAGGGRGMFLVSRSTAECLLRQLPDEYAQASLVGVLAVAAVPFDATQERATLRWLRLRLHNAKDEAGMPMDMPPETKASQCERCRMYQATAEHQFEGGVEHVCARCSRTTSLGQDDARAFGQRGLSLTDLASAGYVAAVSADGNNMGAAFETLESLEATAAASAAVKWLFEQAHESALGRARAEQYVDPVTGGDDLRVFFRPECVEAYVQTLAERVQEGALEFGSLGGSLNQQQETLFSAIGVGVGVAVAGEKTSASWLLRRAHALERSAKQRCLDGARSAVDFAWVSSGEPYLDSSPAQERTAADRRPVAIDDNGWISYVRKARELKRVPSTQRALLAERRMLTKEEFENLFRYQVARSERWRDWYRSIGADWTDPDALTRNLPDAGMLELLRMLDGGRVGHAQV